MALDIEAKIQRYCSFWERTNERALIGFSPGDYFVSRRYEAARGLLAELGMITPDMLDVAAFREDYERLFALYETLEHDIVFVGTPFPGIPWMEAMLGCQISSTGSSFVAHPTGQSLSELRFNDIIRKDWLEKYFEFTLMIKEVAGGRFPVGHHIMRGATDILGTALGQSEFVYTLYENPAQTVLLLNQAANQFLDVIHAQQTVIEPFHDGYAMGFYDLWCPGTCVWFQDDLTSLLSPDLYWAYVFPIHQWLAESAEYTMMHLHPASFYLIDCLLQIEALNAIQITKDVGGPSVEEMLPALQKVQAKKNLVLWGDFTEYEVLFLKSHLSPEGLYIQIVQEPV